MFTGGEENSVVVSSGDIIGEGLISGAIGKRGFETLRGEEGALIRAGDCCRRGDGMPGRIRLLRCRSRELVVLLNPVSEAGDSVLLAPDKIEDGKLLSLSPASLSRKTDERLCACG